MSASLVGSEMCIRDSRLVCRPGSVRRPPRSGVPCRVQEGEGSALRGPCLLYTSDRCRRYA
eukprot:12831734-Alexandrium_andersonii.AAC.1